MLLAWSPRAAPFGGWRDGRGIEVTAEPKEMIDAFLQVADLAHVRVADAHGFARGTQDPPPRKAHAAR